MVTQLTKCPASLEVPKRGETAALLNIFPAFKMYSTELPADSTKKV